MATILTMPGISAGTESAQIISWLTSEGEQINTNDPIIEVETDKAIVEVCSEQDGKLAKILINAGEFAEVGAAIGILLAANEGQAELEKLLAEISNQTEEPQEVAEVTAEDKGFSLNTNNQNNHNDISSSERIFVSPLAKRMAKDASIDLKSIIGSGPYQRIVKKDILQAIQATNNAISSEVAPTKQPDSNVLEVAHTAMRRTIASRLTESKQNIPHFYLKANCIVDDLLTLRARINATANTKISVNDLIVKAVALALQNIPEMNVIWTDAAMLKHQSIDISVAVSTDTGLITPIVKNANNLSVSNLSRQIKELATRAREGKLQRDEYTGGSFTISNLGMYGTEEFSAIINPPQSAILAVGSAKKQAIVKDDDIKIAQTISMTLSVDHRAIDGALAAQWLQEFKQIIENPFSILI